MDNDSIVAVDHRLISARTRLFTYCVLAFLLWRITLAGEVGGWLMIRWIV